MPSSNELIAHGRTDEQVGEEIGADWLLYQDMDDLIDAVGKGNSRISEFDTSVFTGRYITGDVSDEYLNSVEAVRSEAAKNERREGDDEVMDMHNTA